MKAIKIIEVKDGFEWRPISICQEALDNATVNCNDNWRQDPEYELVFLGDALQELHTFIGWGKQGYPKNRVEQIGNLAGKHYQDMITGKKYCVVTHVLPFFEAKGTPTYIEYDSAMAVVAWNSLRRTEVNVEDKSEPIGWFHTHPNRLPTFMSGTDMNTQHTVFNAEYNFSVVLNPHTKSWKAFRGYDARDSECRWLTANRFEDLSDERYSCRVVATSPFNTINNNSNEKMENSLQSECGIIPNSSTIRGMKQIQVGKKVRRLQVARAKKKCKAR